MLIGPPLGPFPYSEEPSADSGGQLLEIIQGVCVVLSPTGSSRCTFGGVPGITVQLTTRQRPSAKELLKHKFIRMAKKTSYLTELIERHERWKAEGGGRAEEDEQDMVNDL